jgi:hypothetical protein
MVMIAALAVLLPGLASAAHLSVAPVRLAPIAMPAMTMAPMSAPSLLSPSIQLSPVSLTAPTVQNWGTQYLSPQLSIVSPNSPEELAFASKAALELAILAEDWGAERGMKAGKMTGKDFLAMVEAGMARYEERNKSGAPSPQAYAAARTVQAGMARIVKALLKAEEPLTPQIRRVLSVWNVFNQEMAAAAEKGSLSAVEEEALLFASQVEQSV